MNYFFSREYIENYGIFFSHFSIYWDSNKFLVEVNLYDGRVEDWIETCISLFSQDLKRLISYSLKSFKLNTKNVEFVRSMDYNFFRFVVSLLLKLVFKLDENLLKRLYFNSGSDDRLANLLFNTISFLVLRNRKEDLVIRKSHNLLKFFLRLFCLVFYQIPLYKNFMGDLKNNLSTIVGVKPNLFILGCENKNVTSNFISRFLARKLAQKYK